MKKNKEVLIDIESCHTDLLNARLCMFIYRYCTVDLLVDVVLSIELFVSAVCACEMAQMQRCIILCVFFF